MFHGAGAHLGHAAALDLQVFQCLPPHAVHDAVHAHHLLQHRVRIRHLLQHLICSEAASQLSARSLKSVQSTGSQPIISKVRRKVYTDYRSPCYSLSCNAAASQPMSMNYIMQCTASSFLPSSLTPSCLSTPASCVGPHSCLLSHEEMHASFELRKEPRVGFCEVSYTEWRKSSRSSKAASCAMAYVVPLDHRSRRNAKGGDSQVISSPYFWMSSACSWRILAMMCGCL